MNQTAERSRDYFERQQNYGRRVIFSFHPEKHWPDLRRLDHENGTHIVWWDEQTECIEGVQFPDERSANAFDLGKSYWEEGMPVTAEFERFETWEEAQAWLVS